MSKAKFVKKKVVNQQKEESGKAPLSIYLPKERDHALQDIADSMHLPKATIAKIIILRWMKLYEQNKEASERFLYSDNIDNL